MFFTWQTSAYLQLYMEMIWVVMTKLFEQLTASCASSAWPTHARVNKKIGATDVCVCARQSFNDFSIFVLRDTAPYNNIHLGYIVAYRIGLVKTNKGHFPIVALPLYFLYSSVKLCALMVGHLFSALLDLRFCVWISAIRQRLVVLQILIFWNVCLSFQSANDWKSGVPLWWLAILSCLSWA